MSTNYHHINHSTTYAPLFYHPMDIEDGKHNTVSYEKMALLKLKCPKNMRNIPLT
jgi:hypothetical protein